MSDHAATEKFTKFVVTGTPGVGKTAFAFFILYPCRAKERLLCSTSREIGFDSVTLGRKKEVGMHPVQQGTLATLTAGFCATH